MPDLHLGFLLFPRLTALDLIGPVEVLGQLPGAVLHLLAATPDPVAPERGPRMTPTGLLGAAPALDVLCVPGGPGVDAVLSDDHVLDELAAQGARARYVTSVCTGALALGAAGLLAGYRATTHWLSLDLLPIFGATPAAERVATDRNRITGGGVTAGLDFGLSLAALLAGEDVARRIALSLEYDPAPAYPGSPRTAGPGLVADVTAVRRSAQDDRRRRCLAAAARRGTR
jgi:cyclohexyl-isocyanide hydratase